jgi:hypothetical protein
VTRSEKREAARKEKKRTYAISTFHGPDKDSRVGGVDAEGFVEKVV